MLSHKVLTAANIGKVAAYYGDGADDYYAKEGESQEWQGKGAEALGLAGEVDAQRFRELLHGQIDPDGPSVRLSTRDDSKDRIGIDLTFSAPKSVSIVALIGGDTQLVAMHDQAVAHALTEAERLAQARQKVAGKTRLETTGNLVIAKFRHETTRAEDPDMHTHSVVLNLTQRADGQWRALKNDEIVKSTKFLGAVYRSELARLLENAGYAITHGREGMFELSSVTREQIEAFSQRSRAIEEHLAEQGLTRETSSQGQRQAATMQTREAKDPTVDRAAMFAEWQRRAAEAGLSFSGAPRPRKGTQRKERSDPGNLEPGSPAAFARDEAARLAVKYAISHLSERDAVMDRRTLINVAVEHSVGATGLREIEAAIDHRVETGRLVAEVPLYRSAASPRDPARSAAEWVELTKKAGSLDAIASERVAAAIANGGLVPIERRYATPRAIEREQQVLAIERAGRGAVRPIMPALDAKKHFDGEQLNVGQKSAAVLILSTANRVVAVKGYAGTGKSHTLDKVRQRVETISPVLKALGDQGYKFRALAPYGSQVKALQALGVQANTLASFLKAAEKGLDEKSVVVLDEAGVVPARQMAALLSVVEAAGARLILVGDPMQTKAIEAGRPFDQLLASGMAVAAMEEIQRQKHVPLKEAVELAARGKSVSALRKIETVIEIPNAGERRAAIARAFVELPAGDRLETLIVSGTNESRREINGHVRAGLGLAGAGREFEMLIRRDTTQAERKFARNYRVGDAIQADIPSQGMERGVLYRITDTGPGNKLSVIDPGGQASTINPALATLSVYQVERNELAIGDSVRITRNDASLDLANGDRFTVEKIDQKAITVTNGARSLSLSAETPLHVDLAYATTVHSSQGLTADRTFYDADTLSRTTAKDVFYVAMSRARTDFRIFTDSVKALPEAVARLAEKRAALDLRAQIVPPQPRDLGKQHARQRATSL